MDSLHLSDLWRLSHPTDKAFTFYSNPHKILTRIDYFFGSDNLIPFVSETGIEDIAISDHAPITLTLELTKKAHLDATLHKFGNKSGKLLSKLSKGFSRPTHITSLRDHLGKVHSTPPAINKAMLQFYTALYGPDPINTEAAQSFLDKMHLPSISPVQLDSLNTPITTDEITLAIRNLRPSKAPGPDGFTSEFYKTLPDIAIPMLHSVYSGIWAGGPYLPSGNQAIIKLLEKKGKDPLEPGSYRPISLLNIDVKILSKIVASRLAVILPDLIHPAQSGFVKGRTATLNIRKVLLALEQAKRDPKGDYAIITLDAEKAFDNVSFDWLSLSLSKMGFNGPFCHLISVMYASPSARLVAAGLLSEEFRLHKGTRQGCPLSPLLFNIALEPLSRFLSHVAPIRGITVGSMELRTSLFADDVLIFTSNPPADVLTIKNIFDDFRICSGLRINYSKSEILPIGGQSKPPWSQHSLFQVATSHITYLGIKIGKLPSSLYHLNYPPLFGKISQELSNWMDLPLSLLGRCHLVKMISFARLLYPLQTIPLLLKHKDISALNSKISKFLWHGKRPRIAFRKLHLPRTEGGISLPHIRMYNLACLVRTSLDWVAHQSRHSNYELESEMAQPYSLVALLHCRWKSVPLPLQHNLLLRDTALAWRETRKILKLPSYISPHLPIRGNPGFLPGMHSKPFEIWQEHGLSNFSALCDLATGKPLSFSTVATQFSLPPSHRFYHNQCVSFLSSTCKEPSWRFKPSFLDRLLKIGHFSISNIYKPLLHESSPPLTSSSIANWSKDFPDPNLIEKILSGLQRVLRLTPNETWRETQLKIAHRAYIPFLSPKSETEGTACPLCSVTRPSLSHRFWSCSFISSFWDQVILYIFEVTLLTIPKDPFLLIFGYWDPLLLPWSSSSSKAASPTGAAPNSPSKDWILLCLLIARRLILRHWISPQSPPIIQLKKDCHSLLYRERLLTDFKDPKSRFQFLIRWQLFISSALSPDDQLDLHTLSFSYDEPIPEDP